MPAGLAGFFGGMAIVFALLFAVTALFPVALAYLALRIRDSREENPDPALGSKTGFHLIHTTGVLMVLTGLSVFTTDIMSETLSNRPNVGNVGRPVADKFPNTAQRSAGALIGVGALFTIIFWAMLLRTNNDVRPAVCRVFLGGRMTISLLIVMGAVTALAMDVVQKDPRFEVAEAALGILFVWVPAALLHLLFFSQLTATNRQARPRTQAANDEFDERGGGRPTRDARD